MKKSIIITIIAAMVIGSGIIGFTAYDLNRYRLTPISSASSESITITVPRGQSLDALTDLLHRKGFLQHPVKFKLLARIYGHHRMIKAGEYRFSTGMTPTEILDHLYAGDVLLHRLTIPEGFNIRQIAERVGEDGICRQDAFLAVATDPAFAKKMGINAQTVEGYLFPDTYFFEKNTPPQKIIATMIRHFRSVFSDKWQKRAKEMGMTVHEIMTLASIIEKESADNKERPIIASVFYNRLERHMRLESDPTVIYGIKDFNGDLTTRDLDQKTPYNTYQIYGLPPGPICNPGIESIRAALYPAKTDYLYFVAKPDKTHHFSRTLAAHDRAVRKYLLH